MRILVASPFLPHPEATHGGAVYLGAFLEALGAKAEVALVSFVRPSELRWQSRPAPGLALVRGLTLRQNFDLQARQLMAHRAKMAWRWGAEGKPLLAAKFWTPAMVDLLTRTAAEFKPDLALVEFAIMAQYLPHLGDLPTVLTDHEHGQTGSAIAPFGLGRKRDQQLWGRYVREYYGQATLVQALNEDDARRLVELIGREVEIRPPVVPIPALPCAPGASGARAIFLGDFTHKPNPESARFLAHEVWPKVRRRLPAAELVLAGPRADDAIKSLGKLPGVQFVGFVEHLATLFGQMRALVAPMFSGAGSRIKILTALAHGLPVISNELGLRGVDAPRTAARLGRNAEEIAAHVVALLEDPREATRAGEAARAWAIQRLHPAQLAEAQLERFTTLLAAGKR